LGEQLAARALRRQGLAVLGRRVATPFGEVDLVLGLKGRLVCAEVKTARSRPWNASGERWRPGRHFDFRSFGRQRRAAEALSRRFAETARASARAGNPRLRAQPPRLDLVEVWIDDRGRFRLAHHPDLRRPLSRGPGARAAGGAPERPGR
jgi:uncharacterized protein UPF0102